MAYSEQTWQDGSSGGTPVNAARLQHMEDGIAAAIDSSGGITAIKVMTQAAYTGLGSYSSTTLYVISG